MALTWAEVDLETKLERVLEAWPHVEQVLIDLSPRFRALENPLLRRTFSRAATLRQVAQAAAIRPEDLLRAMERVVSAPGTPVAAPSRATRPTAPAWTRRLPFARHDARFDVERAIHPLPLVLEELEDVPDGETYELLTPLVPAPLMGLLSRKGYEAWCELDEERGFARTVIRRRR